MNIIAGITVGAILFAALVCGIGLFGMGVMGHLNWADFVSLGVATLGASLVGAVFGLFIGASLNKMG